MGQFASITFMLPLPRHGNELYGAYLLFVAVVPISFFDIFLFQLIIHAESLAIFETHVVAFSNPTNRNQAGQCCQAAQPVSSVCNLSCQTRFEVCLDDLHLEEPNCMFGRNKSQVFRTSNLSANRTSLERSIRISTLLSWPVSNICA